MMFMHSKTEMRDMVNATIHPNHERLERAWWRIARTWIKCEKSVFGPISFKEDFTAVGEGETHEGPHSTLYLKIIVILPYVHLHLERYFWWELPNYSCIFIFLKLEIQGIVTLRIHQCNGFTVRPPSSLQPSAWARCSVEPIFLHFNLYAQYIIRVMPHAWCMV